MNLSDIESIEQATDKQILLIILSIQLQIVRRIETLQSKLEDKDIDDVPSLCSDLVNKFDGFNNNLNEAIARKIKDSQ